MKCHNCGAPHTPDTAVCRYCGSYLQPARPWQPEPAQPPQPASQQTVVYNFYNQAPPQFEYTPSFPEVSDKSRWVAFFLCWFLGGVGAHKFYVGKTGMGFLYLFTGGLLGIGWFIDFFSLLFGLARDKQGRKLS